MKLLSQFALLLLLAGVLAILLSFTGIGPRGTLLNPKAAPAGLTDPAGTPAQPKPNSHPTPISATAAQNLPEATDRSHVRIPAIRGESNYGWVQLPRGTSVELVRQNAGSLIVRWDGIMVKIPQTAADTGAISLRQPNRLAARN